MRTEKEIRKKVKQIEESCSFNPEFAIPDDIKRMYKILKWVLDERNTLY